MDDSISPEKGYYRSLTRNMVLTMIVVSMLPLILISAITRHFFLSSYRDKVHSQLKMVLSRHQMAIDDFLDDRLSAIRIQAKTLSPDQRKDGQDLKQLLGVLQEEYGNSLMELGLLNEQGIQIAYAGPLPEAQQDYSRTPWFKTAVQDGHCVSDVFQGSGDSRRFAVAARQERDGKSWVLYAGISTDALDALLAKICEGPSERAIIINGRGETQADAPDNLSVRQRPRMEFPTNRARSPEVTITESTDEAGSQEFVLWAGLGHGDWALCYTLTATEAYSAIYDARRFSIATLVVGLIGIMGMSVILSKRMITHIARTEREKRAMNEQLIEAGKLASLGEMAAGIAHEINNPVGIMVQEAGWMKDLLDDYEQDPNAGLNMEDFKRSLTRIQTQGRRCKGITLQLLSFARKTDHTKKDAQLNKLIEEVLALSARRARHSNVRIVTNLMADLPTITISPSEIQQVLLNMINNSLDSFDSAGGTIQVSTSVRESHAVIEISDDGPGIAKENLSRIFEPFFTTKPVGKGTGLGLSICYGIIKKFGGDITVTSDLEKGTAFRILMPLGTSQVPVE